MNFISTEIEDVIIIEPNVYRDKRGFFLESYNAEKYKQGGVDADFVQDNHSQSVRGTVRGLHAQYRRPQAKLVRVSEGAVFDVAVDARKGSPSFGRWVGVELSADNFRQLYVPRGFLHGFCVLSERAQFLYKCDNYYDPDGEVTVLWNDPDVGIDWPVEDAIVSEKDSAGRKLCEVGDFLMDFKGRD
jgi:dTDP-4-dehydrorhamnose 3,5-epimerase